MQDLFVTALGTIMTLHHREESTFLRTYRRLPVEIIRGDGMYLYDNNGNRYLDMLAGVAVNALGYGHQRLLAAIEQQARHYIHLSNYFVQTPQVELAERLLKATEYARAFFCNSGTEASEAALKLARKWGNPAGKFTIISMTNSFHGRTMGALSLMNAPNYREGFGPFLDGFVHIPLNDIDELRNAVTAETAAVFLECIQGEGGIYEITQAFAEELNRLKKELGFLVIADEVQSGIGRTGTFLASHHFNLQPDIVMLAKPLGGGLPLGALLVRSGLEEVLQPGMHGTTFGGNPVACAAGCVVVDEVVNNGLMKNAKVSGLYLREQLDAIQRRLPEAIAEVRGRGLMVGVELRFPGKSVVDEMLNRRIIINCTHGNVLRLVPPLIISADEIDRFITELSGVLEHAVASLAVPAANVPKAD